MNGNLPPPSWKICVLGTGAVGGYYGAKLAQSGHEVHFLARRDLAHLLAHGMEVRSHLGDFHLKPVLAHGSTADIGPCDLVVVALKATSNQALESLIPPLIADRTILLTLQNGLGNEAFLAERWGADRVLGGVCFTCINRTAPGRIEHTAQGTIALGELEPSRTDRVQTIAKEFVRSGIDCRPVESLEWARWRKLVWNVPFNGLAIAAGGVTTEQILDDPDLEQRAIELMKEVIAIAARLGHEMPPNLVQDQLERTRGMGAYRPSSMIDFVEGREVEVEAIWGKPWEIAVTAGVPAPRLEMLYRLIRAAVAQRNVLDE